MIAVVSAALLSAFAGGCERREQAEHVAVAPAAAPSDVVFYPHVLYGGEDAYLVDGRWYRPNAGGWVVFTEEPLELELLRRTLEPRQATLFNF